MRYFFSWVLLVGAVLSGVMYAYNPDQRAFNAYLAHRAQQTIDAEIKETESMPLLFGSGDVRHRTIERQDARLYSVFVVRTEEGDRTTVESYLGVAGLFIRLGD